MGRSRAGSGSRQDEVLASETPLRPIVGRYLISKRFDIVGHNRHIGSHHIVPTTRLSSHDSITAIDPPAC